LFQPTAPEIDRCQLLAGKHLQRDDLVAGIDLLIGRRGVGGAERTELVALLGEAGCRPQRGGEQGKYQDCAAHQVPLNGGRSDGHRFVASGGTGVHGWTTAPPGISFVGQMMVGQASYPKLPTGISQILPEFLAP
jgi:hypothetical protein